jgi:subtilase family serine protease
MYRRQWSVPVFAGYLAGVMLIACPRLASAAAGPMPAPAVPKITEPVDESQRVVLGGQVHRAVRDSQDLGEADPRQPAQRIIMVLRGSAAQAADLERFLKDTQSRGTRDYHRWMTPRTFGQRFGAAAADRAIIRTWLQSKGFVLEEEPAGGRSLVFSGTLGRLNEAFATHIHRYRWHGEEHLANSTNPSIPRALAPVVAGFASLNDFRRQAQWVRAQTVKPQYTTGSGVHYLAPGDFATIYDLNSPYARGVTGTGRSIAVIGRSDVASADLSDFRADFGLSATLPTFIYANSAATPPPLVSGDELESDLDLEWSGAVAPAATIKFVTTASTELTDGVDLASQWAVSNNLADVITVSYGSCEHAGDIATGTTFYQQLWQQAAAQGTSVFVSAGDSGAAGCDTDSASTATHGRAVNALCSSPDSTCVGGTEFASDVGNPGTYWSATNAPGNQASALRYIGEAVWNQSGSVAGGSDLYASGGGASIYFAKPAWQLAEGVPSDGWRDVPDLALSASGAHDPYLVSSSDGYPTGTLLVVGGTSAAAPSMAGIAALVAQAAGGRVGNFNPTLYALSGQQFAGGAAVFNRITSGNNSVPGQTGFSAGSGDSTYNQATGLGSIDGEQLIAHFGDHVVSAAGLTPTSAVLPAAAVVGSATLTLPATTSWSATVGGGGAGWLSVAPASGTGSAPLTFSANANSASSARSGTITVDGQVLTVTQAAGSGSTAKATLSSSTLGFGAESISQPSPSQLILVSDTGNASLTLGAITVSGAAATDFTDSGSCVAGLVLSQGASCYLNVTFDPSALGSRSATLQIALAGGGSTSVGLSGTGTPAAPTDGPIPLWSYGLLAIALCAIAARQQQRTSRP